MKKLTKIWSLGLTLALVCSLFAFAAPEPASAAPGGMAFSAQTLPTAAGDVIQNGSDVTDIAVAADGSTVYIVDQMVADCSTANWVRKSTNGGQSFAGVPGLIAASTNKPLKIAVAPDDPNAVAVVERLPGGADLVHISNNGGTTWSTLPALTAAADATDIAVGPARIGTLLQREYAVSLADRTVGVTATGDVQIIGLTTTWRSAGRTTGIAGGMDYMAVEFDPNFVGTRVLIAVGADPLAAAPGPGIGVWLHLINDATGLQVMGPTALQVAGSDYGAAAAVTDILQAEIALPMDFDPTTGSGRRAYIVTTHAVTTNDDVFRVDNATTRALGAAPRAYKSCSYSGTIDEGTLFVGDWLAVGTVRFSTNPQVSLPSWTSTKPPKPSGNNGQYIVRAASDFAASGRVYAGTSGNAASDQSAFSVSNDGGVSFAAESMIDNGAAANDVNLIQSIRLTPDGQYIFMATSTTAVGSAGNLSLWKSTTPSSAGSWSRLFTATKGDVATSVGMVRLNPGWADAPVVYFADVSVGGNIYRSSNGGAIFATRASPANIALVDLAVQDASVIYLAAAGSTNVYKSTTGAWTWGLPKSSKTGNIVSLDVAKEDHLLVGKGGAVAWSTDGAGSFTRVSAGLLSTATYQIVADDDYANNNTIFAGGSNPAVGNVLRYIIGESTTFESLTNPALSATGNVSAGVTELVMQNGVLYALVAEATPSAAVDRHIEPLWPAGNIAVTWSTLTQGIPTASATFTTAPGNVLYSATGTTLSAFDDVFATAGPAILSPGDGSTVGIDPVSGRADLITMAWNPIGTGTAAGDRVDVWIREKGESWAAATRLSMQPVNAASPRVTMASSGATFEFAMRANIEYEWRVRYARAISLETAVSQWSDPFTLKVQAGTVVQQPYAGPVILSPQGGATTSLSPGISWAPYSGATKYQIILATDPTLKNRVAGTPAFVTASAWQPAENLAYGTTYFFAITAVEPTVSPQAIGSFTTMTKPVAPPAPVTIKPVPAPQITLPAPVITIPPAPAPTPITPAFIWAIVIIGAILIIAVIVLIVRTRRPM